MNENNKGKVKQKRKRQTSIITIGLWLFLIATMVTITTSNVVNKEAIEVEDNSWNIQLVMYEDGGTDGKTDVTWNATSESDAKILTMQINYACTTGKEYAPGEIEITVNGISKESFSEYRRNDYYYNIWLTNSVAVAADKSTDTTKKYDWSYSYDSVTNTYTFINNNTMKANEHFEGTIQIAYNMLPRFKIQTDLAFHAKMKENITGADEIIAMSSNICNFHYTSTKKTYTLEKYAYTGDEAKGDFTKIEDILDDYYWVKYRFGVHTGNSGIIYAYDENDNEIMYGFKRKCIKEVLPKGCVLYDENLNKIEPVADNTYYYLYSSAYKETYYYVGYPKTTYKEGDSITNTAELWGRYEDEVEMQKLADASATVKLVSFDFSYDGELYSIEKYGNSDIYSTSIKNGVGTTNWTVSATAFYDTDKGNMDVEIGDDLLYVTRENGDVTRLEDSEYNFTKIFIPVLYTYNKYSGSAGDELIGYKYDLQVRYKNTNEYVSYTTGITSEKNQTITFDSNDVVGVKLVIDNLDKTLYNARIEVSTNIHTKNIKEEGNIYNFDYLQAYANATLLNEPTLDSYATESTKLNIATYDMETYGTYMQRGVAKKTVISGYNYLEVYKFHEGSVTNNVTERRYEVKYCIENSLSLGYVDINKNVIIKTYDILPLGMTLVDTEEDIINNLNASYSFWKNLKLKDGTEFTSDTDVIKFLKEHTAVDIDYNYKDSGRTKVSVITNLNDIDFSYYLTNISSTVAYYHIYLNAEIQYDSILEYGTTYKNYVYSMWNNQECDYYDNIYTIEDSGKYDTLASDIDQDGDTTEKVRYSSVTTNITHAVSSQQAVIKQVRTDLTKGAFVEGTAEATAGSEYTYKLKVTTGANSLKDLILYDTLETIYDDDGNVTSTGWKGTFAGVDTSYAEGKGYSPVVYYSTEANPGSLTDVPDKWQLLDDSVDKTTVKSLCIDLRKGTDGNDFKLSANNTTFVLVKMTAPNDDTILTSANNMFKTTWSAIDATDSTGSTTIDNVTGIYSNQVNVEIHKEDIRETLSGTKTWVDNDNANNTRPESITIKLLQDGQEYATTTTDASKNWEYSFSDVPVYKSNTSKYEYTVEEESVTA